MIIELINKLFGDSRKLGTTPEQRMMAEIKAESVEPLMEQKTTQQQEVSESPYASDIKALEKRFGKLKNGLVINLSLHEALELLPRNRKRSDAYKGLKSELKRIFGVVLNVGNGNTGERQEYPTMLDAAKGIGHNVGSVANAVKSGGITKKGYKFEKL